MNKFVLVLSIFGLFLNGCSSSSSSGSGSPAGGTGYAQCEQVPSFTINPQHNCPGASGTWDNYEVKKDASGTVTSVELWCGGTDPDHPTSQSEYDTYMVYGSATSNGDFKSGPDCVSGSNSTSTQTYLNIWQKK